MRIELALVSAAREAGLPDIFVPRQIAKVARVPILGTGKIDYVSAGKLAVELAARFLIEPVLVCAPARRVGQRASAR